MSPGSPLALGRTAGSRRGDSGWDWSAGPRLPGQGSLPHTALTGLELEPSLKSGGLWIALVSHSTIPGLPNLLPSSLGVTTVTVAQSFPYKWTQPPPCASTALSPGPSSEQHGAEGAGTHGTREDGAVRQRCYVSQASGCRGQKQLAGGPWEKEAASCLRILTEKPGKMLLGLTQVPGPSYLPEAPVPQGCQHAAPCTPAAFSRGLQGPLTSS